MENILMIMIARSILRGMEQIQIYSNFPDCMLVKTLKKWMVVRKACHMLLGAYEP